MPTYFFCLHSVKCALCLFNLFRHQGNLVPPSGAFLLLAFSSTLTALVVCSAGASAQEDAAIHEISAKLAENLPPSTDLSGLTERLSYYLRKPIDLNHSNPDQLKELTILSGYQISNFFKYLKTHGKLKDILELQAINGFDSIAILSLSPFVTARQENLGEKLRGFKSWAFTGKTELLIRYGQVLHTQKGYRNSPGSSYTGGPEKILLKYRYNLNELLDFHIAAEKDPGEALFSKRKSFGSDFLSASLAVYTKGHVKKMIIGDYSLQFGQGLTLWTGLSFGKSADVSWLAKNDTGLKTYTSADEFAFFRGASSTIILLENIYLTPFISYRSLDASIIRTKDGKEQISTIAKTGFHRTASEISNNGVLGQFIYGTAVQWKNAGLEIGITAYHSTYDKEFTPGNQLYRRHGFRGRNLSNFGLHYSYNLKNIYFFGETAGSKPGGLAATHAAMTTLSPSVSTALLIRSFSKNHHTFYDQALSTGGAASNERGIYTGIHFNPNSKWELSVYTDVFHFPGAKYRIDTASSGLDLMGTLTYTADKSTKLTLRIVTETKEQNISAGLPAALLMRIWKENLRLGANWALNARLKMQNRFEICIYKEGKTAQRYSYMFYHDTDFSWPSAGLAANLRFAYFHIPDYSNRIYAYEDDVLYAATSGLYNGVGFRTYLNLNYSLTRRLRTWIRYECSYYPGKQKTGSGLEEIAGNKRSEIKLQLRYQF